MRISDWSSDVCSSDLVPFTGKHLPSLREPELGDVVVFQWPEDPTKNFVKRLVGLPYDTIEMRRGVLFRNGEQQLEDYAIRPEPRSEERRVGKACVRPVRSRRLPYL